MKHLQDVSLLNVSLQYISYDRWFIVLFQLAGNSIFK